MKKQHEIVSSEKTPQAHTLYKITTTQIPFMSSSSSSSLFIIRKPLFLILWFLLSLPLILLISSSIITMAMEGDKGKEPMIDTHENVLQKHAAFFDRNNDGLIYPWETFQGFRAIGSGLALSTVAALLINMGLSGKTRPGKFPNLLFPIEVKNIAKSKHRSDSGVYDAEGRFVPAKFEELFQKHAHTNANALTSDEISGLLKANRVPKDYGGWLASFVEWKVLYLLAKDKNGLLQKDTVRAVYDGSLFERMEKEKSSKHSKTA